MTKLEFEELQQIEEQEIKQVEADRREGWQTPKRTFKPNTDAPPKKT